jgi:hypothetical protein
MRRRILAGGMIAVWRLLTQAAGGAEIRVFTPRTGATVLQELQSGYQKQTGDTHGDHAGLRPQSRRQSRKERALRHPDCRRTNHQR